MKIRMSGDICHPGIIELEVDSLEEARKLFDRDGLRDEEVEFTVELKAICTQTVIVTAKDEQAAVEKAADGEFKIVSDFDFYENYNVEGWKVTNPN